jgi:hypothetical protein
MGSRYDTASLAERMLGCSGGGGAALSCRFKSYRSRAVFKKKFVTTNGVLAKWNKCWLCWDSSRPWTENAVKSWFRVTERRSSKNWIWCPVSLSRSGGYKEMETERFLYLNTYIPTVHKVQLFSPRLHLLSFTIISVRAPARLHYICSPGPV